jgi:hypothetical protein
LESRATNIFQYETDEIGKPFETILRKKIKKAGIRKGNDASKTGRSRI